MSNVWNWTLGFFQISVPLSFPMVETVLPVSGSVRWPASESGFLPFSWAYHFQAQQWIPLRYLSDIWSVVTTNIHHLHRDSLAPVTVICRGKSLPWSLMSIFSNSVALCSGVRVGFNKSKCYSITFHVGQKYIRHHRKISIFQKTWPSLHNFSPLSFSYV